MSYLAYLVQVLRNEKIMAFMILSALLGHLYLSWNKKWQSAPVIILSPDLLSVQKDFQSKVSI